MAYSMAEILLYKFPTEMSNGNIIIQDDGEGPFIKYWNVSGVPQPSPATVQGWSTDPTFIANRALYLRANDPINGYKPLADQLAMIYNDLRDGTQTWQEHIGIVRNINYPTSGVPSAAPDVTPVVVTKRNIPNIPSAVLSEIVIATNTTQSTSGTGNNILLFPTEVMDLSNRFSSDTYTCASSGIYELTSYTKVDNIAISSLAANYEWQLKVAVYNLGVGNPTITMIDSYTHGILAALPASLRGTILLKLNATDTVKIMVAKNASGTLNATNSYLNIRKIASL